MPRSAPPRALSVTARLVVGALAAGVLSVTVPAAPASAAVPPTRAGLTASIESSQPYVGQSICDPVSKAGLAAFRDLVLRTYSGTTSLGIVRDCGIGGQSEHKEGRAWDWGVSASNATQVAQVNALFAWLFATDRYGNTHAMVRRLGLMYVIWNNKIWRAYSNTGWQAYTGADPHTGHVHFSFGWAGARKVTSYWDGTVASIDYGPNGPTVAKPFRSPANIAVLRYYGGTTLKSGSTGAAVTALQKGLGITADGSYGSGTAAAVNRFKTDQRMTADGVFGPDAWVRLFLPPITPFGALAIAREPGGIAVSGWDIDADTTDPLRTTVLVDGIQIAALTASENRLDVAAAYPASGAAHGYSVHAPVNAGSHAVCTYAVNAPGTPGSSVRIGCVTFVVGNKPTGAVTAVATTFGTTTIAGWALDPDSTDPVTVHLSYNGVALPATTASTAYPLTAAWKAYGGAHGFSETATLAEGTHSVCASAMNAPGTPGSGTALGCKTVTVRHSPVGAVDSLAQVPGGAVQVTGFALDPDTVATVPVAVSWDGIRAPASPADQARPDLATRYPGYGTAHGYTASKTLAAGAHTVCVTAVNSTGTPGSEASTGCRTLTVTHSPVGALQVLRTQPGGTALLSGWALDPDTAEPAKVAVGVDGAYYQVLTAGVVRTDLPATWKPYGGGHGFTSTLTLPAGWHSVCTYPLNTQGTPGARVSLGCRTVLVGTPHGALEFASPTPSPGWFNVRGWAFDPDTTSPLTVTLVLDGRTVAAFVASRSRADLALRNPGYGAYHGYATSLRTTSGRHTFCAYARNVSGTPGSHIRLGCRTITVH